MRVDGWPLSLHGGHDVQRPDCPIERGQTIFDRRLRANSRNARRPTFRKRPMHSLSGPLFRLLDPSSIVLCVPETGRLRVVDAFCGRRIVLDFRKVPNKGPGGTAGLARVALSNERCIFVLLFVFVSWRELRLAGLYRIMA